MVNLITASTKEIANVGFFKVAILVPIIEEILFRLILKPSKINITIFSLFFSFYMLNGNFTHIDFDKISTYVSFFLSVCIGCIFYLKGGYYIDFIQINIKYFVWISIILFGLAHVSNISPLYYQLILFYPVFIIPQLIIGYFITNIRLKFNFFWGVLLHCLVNAINVFL
ncbi:CPBP family intramembrane metalloprotease [Elizabethkingia meningoseptica]|nr:CPBP family intramembrane metalloprotease [Elizabethkingia meningoseptica]MDE5510209.1 CPBP family intramembrane metalloprotease [Elizabethkingia meningoseptica]